MKNHSTKNEKKLFRWDGMDNRGTKKSGQMLAASETELRQELAKTNITALNISRVTQRKQFKRASARDIALFSRQVSALIAADVPLLTALNTLIDGSAVPRLQHVIQNLAQQVNAGQSLSAAMATYPKYFNELYISMVAAGEGSGRLALTLQQLSTYLEQQLELRSQVANAIRYPLIVLAISIAITAIMLVFVVPMFADIFKSFGADLPVYTQWLMSTSQAIANYGIYALAVVVIIIFVLLQLYKNNLGFQEWVARRILRFPSLGIAIEQATLARYAITAATLYDGGIPLPDTLNLAAGACGNAWYSKRIKQAATSIQQGGSLSSALSQDKQFDRTTIEMTRIGEDTGRLTDMYRHLSNHYLTESKVKIDTSRRMLEPMMILFIGGLVAGIIFAIYLPIISLVNAV